MRFHIFSIIQIVLIVFSVSVFAQNNDAPYFIYEEGAQIKIGHFNKRQVPQGYTIYTVTNVIETDTADYITIKAESLDPYEKPLNSSEFEAVYFDGQISLDKLYLIPVDTLASIEENDWHINGRDFIMPAFMGNGIALAAAYIELETDDNKFFKVSEFSRMVDKFEKYKTKIGEFETCVVSSKLEMQFSGNEIYTIYTWYSKGIGPIRTDYYNQKRKLVKYSEIVEIVLPEKS
ncbi:MAG: hypothetical protein JXR36_08480 [Bacteroidales bacterium]|nr:hypothetical protein [Bacteroidales bacterium]